jgi:hypothetical protein
MNEYVKDVTWVCKANPLGSCQEVPTRTIIIGNKIPGGMALATCRRFHEKQAQAINKALLESLPQGTYDLLGIMFMQHKTSLYQGRTETAF